MKVNRFGMSQKMFLDMFMAYGQKLYDDLMATRVELVDPDLKHLREAHQKLGDYLDQFPKVILEHDDRTFAYYNYVLGVHQGIKLHLEQVVRV